MKEIIGQFYPKFLLGTKRSNYVLLDTLLPSQAHPELSIGIWEAGFDKFWLTFERTAKPEVRMAFRAALWTGNWIAPIWIGHLPPLSRYDRPTRERALASLGTSRIALLRQMISMLKLITSFCYGANQEVRAAIGYPQRSMDKKQDS
jgi:hypothetical protein